MASLDGSHRGTADDSAAHRLKGHRWWVGPVPCRAASSSTHGSGSPCGLARLVAVPSDPQPPGSRREEAQEPRPRCTFGRGALWAMLEGRRHHDHVSGLGTAERRHGRRRATGRAQRAVRHEGRRGGEERKHRGREVERIWMILTRIPRRCRGNLRSPWGVKFARE